MTYDIIWEQSEPEQTLTVGELREALANQPDDATVDIAHETVGWLIEEVRSSGFGVIIVSAERRIRS